MASSVECTGTRIALLGPTTQPTPKVELPDMAMRIQELHPMLVHAPLTFLPAAIAADLMGKLTGSDGLLDLGRRTMPMAAIGAAAAGVAGFVAQGAVDPDDEAHHVLSPHRNLNLGTAVAAARSRRERPGAGYLLAGFGTVAAMVYGGYLGGRLVYEHRVRVKPEGGWDEEKAPEIRRGTAGEAARTAVRHVRDEVAPTVDHWTDG